MHLIVLRIVLRIVLLIALPFPAAAGPKKPVKLLPVQDPRTGRWCYIDTRGRKAIKPRFRKAARFSDGLALVEEDGKSPGYIDRKGAYVLGGDTRLPGTSHGPFSDGLARVRLDGKHAYLDRTGAVVISALPYLTVGDFHEGRATVRTRPETRNGPTKVGYIDRTGKLVIGPHDWTRCGDFSGGLATYDTGSRSRYNLGYIDRDGKVVIAARYLNALPFRQGAAFVAEPGRNGLIDIRGRWITTEEMSGIRQMGDGVCPVHVKGGWMLIDAKGKRLWRKPMPYHFLDQFDSGRACMGTKDGRYGFIDRSGRVVIAPKYPVPLRFDNGFCLVKLSRTKRYYINTRGAIIWRMTSRK